MKKILTVTILTILISCKKETIAPQSNSTTNNNSTQQTPCTQYGACMDGIYKFEPCNTCWGMDNDTVLYSNAKIKYTFVGYEHAINGQYNDSLKYKLEYVNINLNLFTHFTNFIYRKHGYNWPTVQLSTKTNKNVLFNRNL